MKRKLSSYFASLVLLLSLFASPVSALASVNTESSQATSTTAVNMSSASSAKSSEHTEQPKQTTSTSQSTQSSSKVNSQSSSEYKNSQASNTIVQKQAPSKVTTSNKNWENQFITNNELRDANGKKQDHFGYYDDMQAYWHFNIPEGTKITAGDTMEVSIPDVFNLNTKLSFDIKDAGGNIIGKATADPNTRKVIITFTDYAAQESVNGIDGEFNLWVSWNKTKIDFDKDIPINWGTSSSTVHIDPGNNQPDPTEKLVKWGWYDATDPTIIHWQTRINYAQKDINNAVYTDFVGENQKLIPSTISAEQVKYHTDSDGYDVISKVDNSKIFQDSDTKFHINLGDINQTYVVDYETKATDNGASFHYENSAQLTGDNIEKEEQTVYSPENGGGGDGSTTVNIAGQKIWVDDNNADGLRPAFVTFDLYRNGVKINSQKSTAQDNWMYSFKKLPKYDSEGGAYTYTVKEERVANYDSQQNGNNFTNTLNGTTSVNGTKTWKDNNNQDGKRPDSIKINLLANGKVIQTKTVTATDGWKYSFTGLPKYKDGKEIVYTVTENQVKNYTTAITGNNLVNSYTPKQTSVTVTKAWNDGNNQDGLRPNSVKVQLYANGEKQGNIVTLTKAANWTHTWTGLAAKQNGKTIAYTVKEVGTVAGYTSTINNQNQGNIILTNTYTPKVTSVSGAKTWKDNNNQDGKRPNFIKVNLLANGKVIQTKTVTATNGWKYSFTGLPKYKDGKKIVYTVTENQVKDYTTTIAGNNLVNSYTPKQTGVTVTKAWNDGNDQDGLRPDSVKVQLYANGEKQGNIVTLTKAANWTHTWTGLAVKQNGKAIAYTVKEVGTVTGYTNTVDDQNQGNIIITNSHTPTKPAAPAKPTTPTKPTTPAANSAPATNTAVHQNKVVKWLVKNHLLPQTGEKPTTGLVLLGVVLLLIAGGIIIFKHRHIS
ncbi:collagen adhesin [Liquorilactobacillus ghanensis DSM 18630]|uniref:Collagen adhesin n=1 Tax=Liquorilactobacillus ghanensis DSM 18630 TaxID=1423750 RepID=A0A0R1VNR9_9LACO|nr:Cna B-type domain-containing protein [Liquorilactobacillus ghanensis]KRM07045.1 collagen adhesin [Liquorilactobacillus ghanensis DSM 18630]